MDWQTIMYFILASGFLGYFLSAVFEHIKDTERRWKVQDERWKARNKREAAAHLLTRNGYTFFDLDADINGWLTQTFGKEATTATGRNYYNFWLFEGDGSFWVTFMGSKNVDKDRSDWECRLEQLFDIDLDRIEAFAHPNMSLRR